MMSDQEVLKKALDRAIENGFRFDNDIALYEGLDEAVKNLLITPNHCFILIYDHEFCKAFFGEGERDTGKTEDHWVCSGPNTCQSINMTMVRMGEDEDLLPKYCRECGSKMEMRQLPVKVWDDWETHLECMVTEKYPIAYLRRFMEENS